MPCQKPSTTKRARSSRLRMAMSAAGSASAREEAEFNAVEGPGINKSGGDSLLLIFQQTANDGFDIYAFGFGAIIDQDAMTKDGRGEHTNVLCGNMRTALEKSAGFGPENKRLP